MRALVRDAGRDDVVLDSAGIGGWHVGDPPDRRSAQAARKRGIVLEGAARQVRADDFEDFDLLIAMDRSNQRELLLLAPDEESHPVDWLGCFEPLPDGEAALSGPSRVSIPPPPRRVTSSSGIDTRGSVADRGCAKPG